MPGKAVDAACHVLPSRAHHVLGLLVFDLLVYVVILPSAPPPHTHTHTQREREREREREIYPDVYTPPHMYTRTQMP